jgi:hypothetical protein
MAKVLTGYDLLKMKRKLFIAARRESAKPVAWRVNAPGFKSLHFDERNANIEASHLARATVTPLYE